MKGSGPKTATSFFAKKKQNKDAENPKEAESSATDASSSQRLSERPARPSRDRRHGKRTTPSEQESSESSNESKSEDPKEPPPEASELDPSEVGVERPPSLQRTSQRARKVRIGETRGRSWKKNFTVLWIGIGTMGVVTMGCLWLLIAPQGTPPATESLSSETTPATEDDSETTWSLAPSFPLGPLEDSRGDAISTKEDEKIRMATSARLLASAGPEAALKAAESEAAMYPGSAATQHHAGVMAIAAEQPIKAKAYFLEALAINPESQNSIFNLAQVEFEMGNYDEATRLFSKFRLRDPTNKIAAYRALLCSLLLGEPAHIDLVALPEDSLPGLYARAAIAHASGDSETLREMLERAQAIPKAKRETFESDMELLRSTRRE